MFADEYMIIDKINFNAIFAGKLATLSTTDSTCEIPADNKRAELLDGVLKSVWNKIKKITATALGVGGCVIVPYVSKGKIYYNIIKQNRLMINGCTGDNITSATVLADSIVINDNLYYRFTNYEVIDNTLYITNKTTTSGGSPAVVDEWADIEDIAIQNVDRVLFGFIKSPVDNRRTSDEYGVPITYGCKEIIDDIKECLKQLRREFKLKRVRLQVDERLFDIDPKTGKPIIKDDLFMSGYSEDGKMFNIFDPAIHETSYHSRLDKLFVLLEKQIGTSKGTLSTPQTHGATATEIKEAMKDTFAIITDIRKAIEKGLADFVYACDVLANYYNLTPPGKFKIKYAWDYSLIENTTETWQQLKDGQSIGVRSKAELRAWQTGETLEDAQAAVNKIAKEEPNMQTLLGMSD